LEKGEKEEVKAKTHEEVFSPRGTRAKERTRVAHCNWSIKTGTGRRSSGGGGKERTGNLYKGKRSWALA